MRRIPPLLLSALGLLGGCSIKSEPAGCNNVYDCPSGQTCWTTDGTSFSCVAAGSGALGATCDATVTGIKTISCGEGLMCLSTKGDPTNASCTAWCGGGRPCPTGTTCRGVTTTLNATLNVCL
jgi:hypothetical protein